VIQVQNRKVKGLTLNSHDIHHFLLAQIRHRILNQLHFGPRIREREINFSDTYFNLFVRKGGKKRKVRTYISYVMNLYKLGPEK